MNKRQRVGVMLLLAQLPLQIASGGLMGVAASSGLQGKCSHGIKYILTIITEGGSPDTEAMINLISAILAGITFLTLMSEMMDKVVNTCRGSAVEPNPNMLYEIIVQVKKVLRN